MTDSYSEWVDTLIVPLKPEQWELAGNPPDRVYVRLNRLFAAVLMSCGNDPSEAFQTMLVVLEGYQMWGAMDTNVRSVVGHAIDNYCQSRGTESSVDYVCTDCDYDQFKRVT